MAFSGNAAAFEAALVWSDAAEELAEDAEAKPADAEPGPDELEQAEKRVHIPL